MGQRDVIGVMQIIAVQLVATQRDVWKQAIGLECSCAKLRRFLTREKLNFLNKTCLQKAVFQADNILNHSTVLNRM